MTNWWCPHGQWDRDAGYCAERVAIPDGVWAVWGPRAVRHDCAPTENGHSPWAWHHDKFHEPSTTEEANAN